MAPYQQLEDAIRVGYWGNTTSTLDWCEQNYEVSYYVAEFWNTLSNLGILLPGLLGAWVCWKDKVEVRFILSFLSLAVVGIGSWCFHMTLQYSMQLADEVPMMWTSLVVLFCSLEVPATGKPNWLLVSALTIYGVMGTLIYIVVREPIIFQVVYGLAIFGMIGTDHYLTRVFPGKTQPNLFFWATGLMVFGFFLWNLDNMICPSLNWGRRNLPIPIRPLTQLHAWWHFLAGYASYLNIMFSIHARCHFLNRKSYFEVSWLGLTLRCRDEKKFF